MWEIFWSQVRVVERSYLHIAVAVRVREPVEETEVVRMKFMSKFGARETRRFQRGAKSRC